MLKKQFLTIRTNYIAFHCWPEAPEEVLFLRSLHRHVFHVAVQIPTDHDRELEFFMVQTRIKNFLNARYEGKSLGRKSCEVMAEEIGNFLIAEYNLTTVQVEVNEDGENGSTVVLTKETAENPGPFVKEDVVTPLNLIVADDAQVQERVETLGGILNEKYRGETLRICYSKDAMLYVVDLSRYMSDVDVHFKRVDSWQEYAESLSRSEHKADHLLFCVGWLHRQSFLDLYRAVTTASLLPSRSIATSALIDTQDNLSTDYTCFKTKQPLKDTEQLVGYGLNPTRPYGHKRCIAVVVKG